MNLVYSFLDYLIADVISTFNIKFSFCGPEADRNRIIVRKQQLSSLQGNWNVLYQLFTELRGFCEHAQLPYLKVAQVEISEWYSRCNGLTDIYVEVDTVGNEPFKIVRIHFLSCLLFFIYELGNCLVDSSYAFIKLFAVMINHIYYRCDSVKVFCYVFFNRRWNGFQLFEQVHYFLFEELVDRNFVVG